jgi:hypothetical protein
MLKAELVLEGLAVTGKLGLAAAEAAELVSCAVFVAALAAGATIVSVAVVEVVSVAVVSGSRATTPSRDRAVSTRVARVSAEVGAAVSTLAGAVSAVAIRTWPAVAESTGAEAEAESPILAVSAVRLVSGGAFGAYA